MKFNLRFLSLSSLFFVGSTFCNVVFPLGIPLTFVSVFAYAVLFFIVWVESLFFYHLIKGISKKQAFLMAFVGNMASSFVGSLLAWGFDITKVKYNLLVISNLPKPILPKPIFYILMFLTSFVIEIGIVKLIFKYSFKKLLMPVFLGNVTTYLFLSLSYFFSENTDPAVSVVPSFIVAIIIGSWIILTIFVFTRYVVNKLTLKSRGLSLSLGTSLVFIFSALVCWSIIDVSRFQMNVKNYESTPLQIPFSFFYLIVYALLLSVYAYCEALYLKRKNYDFKEALTSSFVYYGSFWLIFLAFYIRFNL